MNLIGIVVKDRSREAHEASDELVRHLDGKGVRHFTVSSKAGEPGAEALLSIPEADLCITLGGDGTLLFAARVFSRYGVPIIGINMGGLGFLTEYRKIEMIEIVESVLRGGFRVEERIMVDVGVERDGARVFEATGLNDLVITCGGISRLIELAVSAGGKFIGDYRSDGIIVSTPTGSTAYSLAAGGPILDPRMNAFVICPLCPHILGARPLVVPSEEGVSIDLRSRDRVMIATVDGQIAAPVRYMDRVSVEKSAVITRLVSLRDRSFYDVAREKLSWKM
jgi:NAD+ kinase